MTTTYNKLVRDKIPQIIAAQGKTATTEILEDETYAHALDQKLQEELDEYLQSGTAEELADMMEVMLAILAHKDISEDAFSALRLEKRASRGGFAERIFLKEVTEQ